MRFYIIKWQFNKDGTHYINKTSKEALVIKSSSTGTKYNIKLLDNHTPFTYLGVTSAPNGSPKHELQSLKEKTKIGARTLASSPLTRYQSHIYLNTHLQPKIFHPLTTTSLSLKQFDSLKKTYINQVISKCGYNNKWPKALRHGTTYCGLDLKDPSTEAIIKKIKGIQQARLTKGRTIGTCMVPTYVRTIPTNFRNIA